MFKFCFWRRKSWIWPLNESIFEVIAGAMADGIGEVQGLKTDLQPKG